MPYSVSSPWNVSSNILSQVNLSAGQYPISVIDSFGCVLADTINVDTSSLGLLLTASHTTCLGCADGEIGVSADPGVSVSWMPVNGTLNGSRIQHLQSGAYTVCVNDTNQCMRCEDIVLLDDPLNVHEMVLQNQIFIFPNPSSGSFTLRINNVKGERMFLDIIDVYGKRRSREFYDLHECHYTGQIPAGVYFLRVNSEDSLIGTCKMVIN